MHIDTKMSILTYYLFIYLLVEQLKTVVLKLGKHMPQMERRKSAQGNGHDGLLTISFVLIFFFSESLILDREGHQILTIEVHFRMCRAVQSLFLWCLPTEMVWLCGRFQAPQCLVVHLFFACFSDCYPSQWKSSKSVTGLL